MKGPLVSGRNAKPHNVGRQFFSSGRKNSFMWADGVRPWEDPEGLESWALHAHRQLMMDLMEGDEWGHF